ncbi:MAG: hypothetical protein M0T74_05995 [Desulfitobacterium hafniense]|nr:hypothetical protein [Desulfitobacterium hafniense]
MQKDSLASKMARIQAWSEGKGRYKISLTLFNTGRGISAVLIGGDSPHIGGVVLAVPRPSLTGDGYSADDFVIPVPHHKDVEVAKPIAHALACTCRAPVTLSAGIHSDDLTREEIDLIKKNCDQVLQLALQTLKKEVPDNNRQH